MELTLLHPKIVHLPIALAVLMPLLVLGLWAVRTTDWLPRRVWWIAIAFQALLVASSFVALETGEIDEERAERIVAESAIEAHEEAAEAFTWTTVVALPFLLPLGFLDRRSLQHALSAAALLATGLVTVTGYQVGQAGGAIVYEHGMSKLGSTSTSPPVPTRSHDDDDD